jgi:sigma-E factor negative regulatory protein RseA
MNEQEQISQLSALFDNELPPAQSEMVIRRALKDPALRESWERYALIGACVRNEPLHLGARHADVADRVRARLAAEAEHGQATADGAQPGNAGRGRSQFFGRGALGGAIAAGVAVLSIFVFRSMSTGDAGPPALVAQAAPVAAPAEIAAPPAAVLAANTVQPRTLEAARELAPPSYTTPVDNSPASQRMSAPLVNYVVAHSDVAASAVRFSPLSSVMTGNFDLTQGTVEMTEAEIGAHR